MIPSFHITHALMFILQLFAFCSTTAVASCNEGQYYASCTFTDAVEGKSPGSNVGGSSATQSNVASLEECMGLCCANPGARKCRAIIYRSDNKICGLLDRTYNGKFQTYAAGTDSAVVSNLVSELSCSTCGTGQYQNLNAHTSTSCKTCDIGQYAATATASACSSCAAGEYQPSNPSITYNCLACAAGQFAVDATVECKACETGQYQELPAATSYSCKTCGAGQYAATATASACSSCAAGEYQPSNPSITYNCLACESNCQACTDETTCTTCNSGYSKRLGNCYPTCGSGYTLHGPYYTATCKITCDDPNCETCDPADTCTTCSAGNPIPTSSGGCLPPDADKDGIPDYIECPDPTDCVDTDSDGVPDKSDDDSDNDGINDAQEAGMTMTPAEIKCALSAYHDQGSCGCGANDQQSDWCGPSHAGICPQTQSVATSICSSGKAVLNTYHQKAATIAERTFYDNCIYMFLAQVSLRFRLFLFLLSLGYFLFFFFFFSLFFVLSFYVALTSSTFWFPASSPPLLLSSSPPLLLSTVRLLRSVAGNHHHRWNDAGLS